MNINNNKYQIVSSNIAPNPTSVKYWADLNNGGKVKVYNNGKWEALSGDVTKEYVDNAIANSITKVLNTNI